LGLFGRPPCWAACGRAAPEQAAAAPPTPRMWRRCGCSTTRGLGEVNVSHTASFRATTPARGSPHVRRERQPDYAPSPRRRRARISPSHHLRWPRSTAVIGESLVRDVTSSAPAGTSGTLEVALHFSQPTCPRRHLGPFDGPGALTGRPRVVAAVLSGVAPEPARAQHEHDGTPLGIPFSAPLGSGTAWLPDCRADCRGTIGRWGRWNRDGRTGNVFLEYDRQFGNAGRTISWGASNWLMVTSGAVLPPAGWSGFRAMGECGSRGTVTARGYPLLLQVRRAVSRRHPHGPAASS